MLQPSFIIDVPMCTSNILSFQISTFQHELPCFDVSDSFGHKKVDLRDQNGPKRFKIIAAMPQDGIAARANVWRAFINLFLNFSKNHPKSAK